MPIEVPRTGGSRVIISKEAVAYLSRLGDVDASGGFENYATLVYDSSINKFRIMILPVIDGGTF